MRAFNPELPVHGLFGGEASEAREAVEELGPILDSFRGFHLHDGRWRWQHTDHMVRHWFRDFGYALTFDVVHVIQWDLLFFAPLKHLYGHVPRRAVALTGIIPVQQIADRWHWTRVEPHRSEWEELLAIVRAQHGYDRIPLACIGPAYALPRTFLELYAEAEIPDLCHDELRLPLFGQLFDFRLVDTGFYPRWFDEEAERLFNAHGAELPVDAVRAELLRPDGRRAFHACRESYGAAVVESLLRLMKE